MTLISGPWDCSDISYWLGYHFPALARHLYAMRGFVIRVSRLAQGCGGHLNHGGVVYVAFLDERFFGKF